jgi:c-di-GMP-binding flagellar brake protein YcgR
MTKERRSFPRVPQPMDARYRPILDMGASWHHMTVVNISAGGVRFRSDEPVEPGSPLELHVQLPGLREPLALKGAAVWSTLQASGVSETGVEFQDVSPEQQLQIDDVVRFLRS